MDKVVYFMMAFIRHYGKDKTIGKEIRLVISRALGWREGIDYKVLGYFEVKYILTII